MFAYVRRDNLYFNLILNDAIKNYFTFSCLRCIAQTAAHFWRYKVGLEWKKIWKGLKQSRFYELQHIIARVLSWNWIDKQASGMGCT
jgi:hypothetical protein